MLWIILDPAVLLPMGALGAVVRPKWVLGAPVYGLVYANVVTWLTLAPNTYAENDVVLGRWVAASVAVVAGYLLRRVRPTFARGSLATPPPVD